MQYGFLAQDIKKIKGLENISKDNYILILYNI
jgi:hypothetical protein